MKLTTHLRLALRLMSSFIPPAPIRLHSLHTDIVTIFETSFALHKPLSLSHAGGPFYHLVSYNVLVTYATVWPAARQWKLSP